MSHEAVFAALPNSKGDAKSLKDIAHAIGLAASTYMDWVRAERNLARVLRILIKWGWGDHDRRQSENGHKFWYNVYWKTEMAIQQEAVERE